MLLFKQLLCSLHCSICYNTIDVAKNIKKEKTTAQTEQAQEREKGIRRELQQIES